MKQIIYLLFTTMILASCGNQLCKQTVSYTKATAIYGDLNAIRNQPVNDIVQEIENPGKIFLSNDYLFIGEEGKGIHVLDNSDPTNPIRINFINIHQNREYYIEGPNLYAESFTDIVKYDISNPTNVEVISRANEVFQAPTGFNNNTGEQIVGFNLEYVVEDLDCDTPIFSDQVNFFSWDNQLIPASSVPSSFAGSSDGSSGTINRITYTDGYVYAINWNQIYTLSDNGGLELQGDVYGWGNMETIYPQGENLFIGTQTGMLIYSLANSNEPEFYSSFTHATACDPVLPKGDVVYVTLRSGNECQGTSNELDVVNIQDIDRPTLSNVINMDTPYGMTIIGETLFVGQGESGLSIFDISNKLNPVLIKEDTSIQAYDVISNPNNPSQILITGENGIRQYQVSTSKEAFTLLSTIAF